MQIDKALLIANLTEKQASPNGDSVQKKRTGSAADALQVLQSSNRKGAAGERQRMLFCLILQMLI